MLFGLGLQCHIFVNMLGVSPYSVDAGFNSLGRSYSWCNMKARCGRDVFLRDHTTSVRNFKWKMMSQTHDVIYQNDLQKLRNWSISHKNGVRTTWKKLWIVKGNTRELLIFCYKMGCVKTTLKLVRDLSRVIAFFVTRREMFQYQFSCSRFAMLINSCQQMRCTQF
jgi:hypothetical protein